MGKWIVSLLLPSSSSYFSAGWLQPFLQMPSLLRVRKTQHARFTHPDLSLCGQSKSVTHCTYRYICAHYQNQKRKCFDSDTEVQWNENMGISYHTSSIKLSFVALVRKYFSCFQQTMICVKRSFLPRQIRAKQWK